MVKIVRKGDAGKAQSVPMDVQEDSFLIERVAWKLHVPKEVLHLDAVPSDPSIRTYLLMSDALALSGPVGRANLKLFFPDSLSEAERAKAAKWMMRELLLQLQQSLQSTTDDDMQALLRAAWDDKVHQVETWFVDWNLSNVVDVIREVHRKTEKQRQDFLAELTVEQAVQEEKWNEQFREQPIISTLALENAPPVLLGTPIIHSALIQYTFPEVKCDSIENLFAQLTCSSFVPWFQYKEWNKVRVDSTLPREWYDHTLHRTDQEVYEKNLMKDGIRFRLLSGECGVMTVSVDQHLNVWIRSRHSDPLGGRNEWSTCFHGYDVTLFARYHLTRTQIQASCLLQRPDEDLTVDPFLLSAFLFVEKSLRAFVAVRETNLMPSAGKDDALTLHCWLDKFQSHEDARCVLKRKAGVYQWEVLLQVEVSNEQKLDSILHLVRDAVRWYLRRRPTLLDTLSYVLPPVDNVMDHQPNLWEIDADMFPKTHETGCQTRPLVVKENAKQGVENVNWLEYTKGDKSYILQCPPAGKKEFSFIGFQTIAADDREEPCCYVKPPMAKKASKGDKKQSGPVKKTTGFLDVNQRGELPTNWKQLLVSVQTKPSSSKFERIGMLRTPYTVIDAILFTLVPGHSTLSSDKREEVVRQTMRKLVHHCDSRIRHVDAQHTTRTLAEVEAQQATLDPVEWRWTLEQYFQCNVFVCSEEGWLYPEAHLGERVWKQGWAQSVFVWKYDNDRVDAMSFDAMNRIGHALRPYVLMGQPCWSYALSTPHSAPALVEPFAPLPSVFLQQCTHQVLDRNGRCRALVYRDREEVLHRLWCDPMPPLPLEPLDYRIDLFQPSATVIPQWKPVGRCEENDRIIEMDWQVGEYVFTEVVDVPLSSAEPVAHRPRRLPRFDRTHRAVQRQQRLARLLTHYLLYAFSNWWHIQHANDVLSLQTHREITVSALTAFVKNMHINPEVNYTLPLSSTLSESHLHSAGALLSADHKWQFVVTSETARRRWAYVLFQAVKTQSTRVAEYRTYTTCADWFHTLSDWLVPDDDTTVIIQTDHWSLIDHRIHPQAVSMTSPQFVSNPSLMNGIIGMVKPTMMPSEEAHAEQLKWVKDAKESDKKRKETEVGFVERPESVLEQESLQFLGQRNLVRALQQSSIWNRDEKHATQSFEATDANRVTLTFQPNGEPKGKPTVPKKGNSFTHIATLFQEKKESAAWLPFCDREAVKKYILEQDPNFKFT